MLTPSISYPQCLLGLRRPGVLPGYILSYRPHFGVCRSFTNRHERGWAFTCSRKPYFSIILKIRAQIPSHVGINRHPRVHCGPRDFTHMRSPFASVPEFSLLATFQVELARPQLFRVVPATLLHMAELPQPNELHTASSVLVCIVLEGVAFYYNRLRRLC